MACIERSVEAKLQVSTANQAFARASISGALAGSRRTDPKGEQYSGGCWDGQ
jgi:hypothetical protein